MRGKPYLTVISVILAVGGMAGKVVVEGIIGVRYIYLVQWPVTVCSGGGHFAICSHGGWEVLCMVVGSSPYPIDISKIAVMANHHETDRDVGVVMPLRVYLR